MLGLLKRTSTQFNQTIVMITHSMPESEQEILIEKEYLDYWKLDAGIGDRISILMPNTQEEREFTISGYLKTAASGTGRSLYAAIVSEQYFVAHGGWDGFSPAAMIWVNAGGASSKAEIETLVTEVLARAGIMKIPSFNETYINLSRPSVLLIGAAAAGLAVIIAACILVIYNIFYIAIINSIQEYGRLRTLGMTGRQIKRLVLREGLALSVRSIPAGLGTGTVLSCLLIPQGFRPVSLLWVWPVVTVLVYLSVRLSLRKPALLAASISPIAASRYTGQQIRKNRLARRAEKISPVMLAKKYLATNRKKNVRTVLSLALTGILLMGFSSWFHGPLGKLDDFGNWASLLYADWRRCGSCPVLPLEKRAYDVPALSLPGWDCPGLRCGCGLVCTDGNLGGAEASKQAASDRATAGIIWRRSMTWPFENDTGAIAVSKAALTQWAGFDPAGCRAYVHFQNDRQLSQEVMTAHCREIAGRYGLFLLVLFGLEFLLSAWTAGRQRKQSLMEQMRAVE